MSSPLPLRPLSFLVGFAMGTLIGEAGLWGLVAATIVVRVTAP